MDEAVKKIRSKLECSKCEKEFQQPKFLPCFHTYCESCLERLVVQGPDGQILTCPTCRHLITLPDNGVAGLQTDFHIEHLHAVRESLEKVSKTECENCKSSEVLTFCQQCGIMMCENCTEMHKMWGSFSNHTLLGIDEAKASTSDVKISPKCGKHPSIDASIYCETCSELMCSDCSIYHHKDHKQELLLERRQRHKGELLSSMRKLKQKLETLQSAREELLTSEKEITDQRATAEADIHKEIDQLHQLLDKRRTELIASLETHTQQKLKVLDEQREVVERICTKMTRCVEYVVDCVETDDLVRAKETVLRGIDHIMTQSEQDTQPQTVVDTTLRFLSDKQLPEACDKFGEIVYEASSENTYETLDDIKFQVGSNKAYELVDYDAQTETSTCTVQEQDGLASQNVKSTNMTFAREQDISPSFNVTPSLESFDKPVRMVRGLKGVQSMTVNSRNQLIVAECTGHRISVFLPDGRKSFSFGKKGSGNGQFKYPCGVAVDKDDNIYVTDNGTHRVQKFSNKGRFVASVGTHRTVNSTFNHPIGICFNKTNQLLYVCDQGNYKIQALSTELAFVSSFGSQGSGNGQFQLIQNVAFDSSNNLYVTDQDTNRVQVFTAGGQFLRAFSDKANGQKLEGPYDIDIDSNDRVYVTESNRNRISVFTILGEYIESFGVEQAKDKQFQGAYSICIGHDDTIIVSKSSTTQKRFSIS